MIKSEEVTIENKVQPSHLITFQIYALWMLPGHQLGTCLFSIFMPVPLSHQSGNWVTQFKLLPRVEWAQAVCEVETGAPV